MNRAGPAPVPWTMTVVDRRAGRGSARSPTTPRSRHGRWPPVGDREAAATSSAHASAVWRFVAHLAGPADADDLTQETYLRALASLPRFAGRSCARTWLLSIARRVVIDRYRYESARPRLHGADDWQAAAERVQDGSGTVPGFEEGVALLDLLPRPGRPAARGVRPHPGAGPALRRRRRRRRLPDRHRPLPGRPGPRGHGRRLAGRRRPARDSRVV